MLCKHEANPQKNNSAARSPQSDFETLLKSPPCTDVPPKLCSTPAYTSGGLLLYVQIILKDSNYKKLLFTAVKRNLLTLRNKEINK